MQASFTIANKSSRHGHKELPSELNKVDEPIASFCLNLVGTLIIFITDRFIESKPKALKEKTEKDTSDTMEEDSVPF